MTYTNVNEADDNEAERRVIWSNNRVDRREFLRRMAVIGGGCRVGRIAVEWPGLRQRHSNVRGGDRSRTGRNGVS